MKSFVTVYRPKTILKYLYTLPESKIYKIHIIYTQVIWKEGDTSPTLVHNHRW